MRVLIALAFACCLGGAYSQPLLPALKSKHQAKPAQPQGAETETVAPLAPVIQAAPRYSAENNPQQEEKASRLASAGLWFHRFIEKFVDDPIAWFTLVLAIFTIRLWKSTHRLAIGAEDTARRQLRAYVLVKTVCIENELQELTSFRDPWAYIVMTNFGKLPATNLSYQLSITTAPALLKGGKLTPTDGGPQRLDVIAPSDTFKVRLPIHVLDLEFRGSKNAVYLFGSIAYDDGFSARRITNFRFIRVGDDWAADGEFDMCQEGNECT